METRKDFKTYQDGTSLLSSTIRAGVRGEKGFITGNPNNYVFTTNPKNKSFIIPAHFYASEADRIVEMLNGYFETDSEINLTTEIEGVRLSNEVSRMTGTYFSTCRYDNF